MSTSKLGSQPTPVPPAPRTPQNRTVGAAAPPASSGNGALTPDTVTRGLGVAERTVGLAGIASDVSDGIQAIGEGNYLEGVRKTGKASIDAINDTVALINEINKGPGAASTRLQKLATSLNNTVGADTRLGQRLAIAGSGFSVLGGALNIKGGVENIQAGNVLEGGIQVFGGTVNSAQGLAKIGAATLNTSSKLGAASNTAGIFLKKAAPVLGVASGVMQATVALNKTPPQYAKAATGAMTAAGSALAPFPPIGTLVGGSLVLGAAVIDNWEAISGAAKGVGGLLSKGWNALKS
ncbi:MAG: hypothetical protein VKN33_02475 [Candidatus Sericytochromatia bacterium]|nr:hypothetical protein [Candidatus Sericytochromatia bacterium]